MAKGQLPKAIAPLRLADKGAVLQGWLSLQEMPRLVEMTNESTANIYVDLTFAKDEKGIPHIKGTVQAALTLTCQRCLQPVEHCVNATVKVQPVVAIEAAQVPHDYEPLLVTSDSMSLAEIVEEELLLNLPLVAKHNAGSCPVELPWELR